MVLPVLLAALAAAPSSAYGFPFEALANELFALERPELVMEAPERPSPEARLRYRLAGLHRRVPLGGFELWVPVETMVSPGRSVPGLEAKEVSGWALALIELQRRWLPRVGLEGDALERASDDLDTVERWLKGFRRRGDVPELKAETARALVRIESALLATPATDRVESRTLPPLVIMIAPTRIHYAATIGAIGIEQPGLQSTLWTDLNLRTASQFPDWRTTLVGMTYGPAPDEGPVLLDVEPSRGEVTQTIVHLGSLLLMYNLSTTLPPWFGEGIAIGDTVAVTGADETVFSGHRRSDADRALAQLSGIFTFLYAENSPYRDGPSRRLFLRELKKAHRDGSFRILDLVKGGIGLHARGPFLGQALGAGATLPDELREGPPGVRNGYAEFFRAYSAAFVHWLQETEGEGASGSRLDRITREVRTRCMGRVPEPRRPLGPVLEAALGPTSGASADPVTNLEAEFRGWLIGRAR